MVPKAYMWKGGKWEYVGEVMAQGTHEKRHYHGDRFFPKGEYDYVFEVDVAEGAPKSKLPYNEGENPLVVAEKFLTREGMNLGYKEQITDFIRKHTKGKGNPLPGSQQKPLSETKPAPQSCFPLRETVYFKEVNQLDALLAKIQEFNAKLHDPAHPSHQQALTDNELKYVQSMVAKLRDPGLYTYVKEFSDFEIEVVKKLVRWPADLAVPVMDLWRCILLHHASQVFFSGVDSGLPIIAGLVGKLKTGPNVLWTIFYKMLSNFFLQTSNSLGIVRAKDILAEAFKQLNKKDSKVVAFCANFLLNCSSTIDEQPSVNDQFVEEQIHMIGELVREGELTAEAQMKLAIALGNFATLRPSAASQAPIIMKLFIPRLEPLQDEFSKNILSSFRGAAGI